MVNRGFGHRGTTDAGSFRCPDSTNACGLRHCWCSVQICDNYAVAAMHCQELSTAAKACIDAVKLSSGKHVNSEVLAALVSEVESRRGVCTNAQASQKDQDSVPDAQGLKQGSAQQAELDASCCEGGGGNDEAMGQEAARLLDAFGALPFESTEPEAFEQSATSEAASQQAQDDADAQLRQRTMLVSHILYVLVWCLCKLCWRVTAYYPR